MASSTSKVDRIEECSINFEQVYMRDELTLFGGLGSGQFFRRAGLFHKAMI